MNFITIDPGLKGGIAWSENIETNRSVGAVPMPIKVIEGGKGSRKALDTAAIIELVSSIQPQIAIIELQQAMPKQGVSSTFKTGYGYGLLVGLLEGLGVEVLPISPRKWKKIHPADLRRSKEATLDLVAERFPTVSLVAPRGRVRHDGIGDALGMMVWCLDESPL